MINTDSITPEMLAQVAREIQPPAAGFATDADRRAFEQCRELRLFNLTFEMQKFLDLYLDNDEERQMAIKAYRQAARGFLTLLHRGQACGRRGHR